MVTMAATSFLRPTARHTTVLILLALASLPACLVRKRVVTQPGTKQNQPLLKATKEQLIELIHSVDDPIQSFNLKVQMSPSIGSLYGGEITDYPTIRGFILFARPDQIRVIGLDPVIHSTAFDMVSRGNQFSVLIPSKNLFIEGRNDAPANSKNKLENLRPTAFLNSLVVVPPNPQYEISVLQDDTDESKAVYIMTVLHREGEQIALDRNIYFDRRTLQINRQKTFNANGEILGETRYEDWKSYGNTRFPASIDIRRPQDGYEVTMDVSDLRSNDKSITAEKFNLVQPPNAQVREIK
jgi:outer membrane lipoprotein-sorting protein